MAACDQSRRKLKDSVTRRSYAKGTTEANMDGMIVLPHAQAPMI